MAITDAEGIRFSDEKIRVAANLIVQLYYVSTQISNEWTGRNLIGRLSNTPDIVNDGSHTGSTKPDGRPSITGVSVNNIIDLLNEFKIDYEDRNNAKLNMVLRVATNANRD